MPTPKAKDTPTTPPNNPNNLNPEDNNIPDLTTPHALLTYLYRDVTRLSQISAPSLILHPADRDLTSPPRPPLVGIAAAQQHEEDLVAATGGTLVMDVESITVDGRGVFGCVMGILRVGSRAQNKSGGRDAGRAVGSEGMVGGHGEEKMDGGEGNGKGAFEVPFCGLWRFDENGRAVEHWENAADPAALGRWLRGE